MSSLGPLQGKTNNYGFNLVNFNWFSWHDYEYENWTLLDAILLSVLGVPNIKGIWQPNTEMKVGERWVDGEDSTTWDCLVDHVSGDGTFAEDRAANPTYWAQTAFFLQDGTETNPSLAFAADDDTGLFRAGDDAIGVTAGGTEQLRIAEGFVQFPDGSVAMPAIGFLNDPDTGFHHSQADTINVAVGGVLHSTFYANHIFLNGSQNTGIILANTGAPDNQQRIKLTQHDSGEFRLQQFNNGGGYIGDDLRHPIGSGWQFGNPDGGMPNNPGEINAPDVRVNGDYNRDLWTGTNYTTGGGTITIQDALSLDAGRLNCYHITMHRTNITFNGDSLNIRMKVGANNVDGSVYRWCTMSVDHTGVTQAHANTDTAIRLTPPGGWSNTTPITMRIVLNGYNRRDYRPMKIEAWGSNGSAQPAYVVGYALMNSNDQSDGMAIFMGTGSFQAGNLVNVKKAMT